ncbi:L-fuconolactonase [bacterium A37T11]|nr:L-fuconolactonase [bacterium A37T11]
MTLAEFKALNIPVTDSHVHLWDTELLSYPWLAEVPAIQKTLSLSHFQEASAAIPLAKLIFMQCECLPEQYVREVEYITGLAATDDRLTGIISWFPLEAVNAAEELALLAKNPLIKGIRRLEESPASLYKNPEFTSRLGWLSQHKLSFDICLKSHQLPAAIHLVDKAPEVDYMLDHLGKPEILNQEFRQWSDAIRILAQNPQVYCKVSGLVTEADLLNWKTDDLRPYFDYAADQFGPDRLVFGGDWPVVTLATSYATWIETLLDLCRDFSPADLDKLFSQNAKRFYRV